MATDNSLFAVATHLKLVDVERYYMQRVLDDCGGNLAKASKSLGVPRATMYRKIKKYKLVREKKRAA